MSIFDFFKKEKGAQTLHFAPTQTGRTPFYSDFGSNIYASDIVVQSIRCKANEFKSCARDIFAQKTDNKPRFRILQFTAY